jgi:indole-3-glycerol phosphate synthase
MKNPDVLEKIVAHKRREVAALTGPAVRDDLARRVEESPPPRDFLAALRQVRGVPIIAEIKRGSPSAGTLRQNIDPARTAAAYQAGGAAALSVLTDRRFFQGSPQDLEWARAACDRPVLRKDFIIDPIQLVESRAMGADAVLLIAAALGPDQLVELYGAARDLGLTPLVEVHHARELPAILDLDPPLIGVNNRDLKTLEVDLMTCLALRPMIPDDVLVVAESGIATPADVTRLVAGGLNAFLVGTALMRADDPAVALRDLVGAEKTDGQG